jgi:hypothetical protein
MYDTLSEGAAWEILVLVTVVVDDVDDDDWLNSALDEECRDPRFGKIA